MKRQHQIAAGFFAVWLAFSLCGCSAPAASARLGRRVGSLSPGRTHGLKALADSCAIAGGSYRKLAHEEVYEIFRECLFCDPWASSAEQGHQKNFSTRKAASHHKSYF